MIQRGLTIEDLSRKLKPLFGNKIDELYLRYSTADNLEEKNEILQILTALYQKNLSKLLDKGVLLEPPKQEELEGEYPLAKISYAGKQLFDFSLREKDWPRHVCITGMSGSGKTTFAYSILENFIKKEKPFLVFDWKKSFRPLMKKDNSLMIFTVGNKKVSNLFKININIPPKGVSPKEWINVLCDLLTESFMVSFGVHKILLETLDETFQGWGVYEGGKHYPNWKHIKKMLEIKAREAKGREAGWYESALRIATVLTFGDFGDVVNYEGKKSFSVEELFDKKVVFELNSLSNIEKKFFCEFILTYIYKYKKANQDKTTVFNHAILVDEAHNVFLKNKTHFVSESVTDMVYREMREYGTSLICLDQHISKLSDTVTGNSACHIAFQQQLPQDIYDISSLMQLSEKREIFSQLPVGSAVVKLSERYNSPFLIETPFSELTEISISDERISSKMQCILEGNDVEKNDPEFKEQMISEPIQEIVIENPLNNSEPLVSKDHSEPLEIPVLSFEKPTQVEVLSEKEKILYEFVQQKLSEGLTLKEIEKLFEQGLSQKLYSLFEVMKVINYELENQLKKCSKKSNISRDQKIDLEGLGEDEKKFLQYLIENPHHKDSTVELYRKLGFSTRKGNIIKGRLLLNNYIEIEEVKYQKGWKKFIRLSNSLNQ
jgi:dephospho-CoA kinase